MIVREALEFFEASPFPGGNSPCARPHKVVRGVYRSQKRLSQAEAAVTGAVEHCDRKKVEFEEGQRRLANLQAEAQNPLAPVHSVGEMEAEIRRLREDVAE